MKQGCNISPLLSNIYQNDLHEIFDMSCGAADLNGHKLNSLSWADDLVLISTSPTGLQNCLDALHQYCCKWDISINPTKTVCMVMAKGKIKKLPKFFINGQELLNSNSTTYLGFRITSNMSTKSIIEDRILKANRASYILRQALSVQGNIDVKLALTLFDKMISPILLYGCSIWVMPKTTKYIYIEKLPELGETKTLVKQHLLNICGKHIEIDSAKRVGKVSDIGPRRILVSLKFLEDKFYLLYNRKGTNECIQINDYDYRIEDTLYEKLHARFLKFVLNVNKFSSNLAVRGELGRFPLSIKALSLSVKYWHNIITLRSPNLLLSTALSSDLILCSDWLQGIQYILRVNGFNNLWQEPHTIANSRIYIIVKKRLEDQYIQTWFSQVSSSCSFGILNIVKNDYTCSSYLSSIESHNIRSIVTKLRINNSILKCCRGNTPEELICPMCDLHVIENVEHFLLHCPKQKALGIRLSRILNGLWKDFVR